MMEVKPITEQTEKKFDSNYYVEGYATTFEPYELYEFDGIKYNEQIDRNALDGADMSDVIMQYDHQGKVMARMSNNTLKIGIDERGIWIGADLSKSEASRQLYEEIQAGLINKMSWAFTISEDDYNEQTRTRVIKRVKKVYDVSAVSIPANQDTTISARTYFDGVIEKERQELLKRKKLKLLLEMEC